MALYIHMLRNWPHFQWNNEKVNELLVDVRHQQGRVLGRMEALGFSMQAEANLKTLTLDILKSSEIEGESLDAQEVRSSIARRLGMDIGGLVPADRHVEGVVEMMLDATQNYLQPLSTERLWSWQSSLFPAGRSGRNKIVVGAWRDNAKDDPMQVVSGASGRELIHFQAPDADRLNEEMERFIRWFNESMDLDVVLKAAVAHLWFVTVHPFDDGNGRIARTIADMQLSRADASAQRFYSMSAQIRKERKQYYSILESTQKGDLDITDWLVWFLECFGHAVSATDDTLALVLKKAHFWERHTAALLNERQLLMLNKLLDGFEGKLNTSKWAIITKVSQDSALRDIQDLLDKGILVKDTSGGRSTSYLLAE